VSASAATTALQRAGSRAYHGGKGLGLLDAIANVLKVDVHLRVVGAMHLEIRRQTFGQVELAMRVGLVELVQGLLAQAIVLLLDLLVLGFDLLREAQSIDAHCKGGAFDRGTRRTSACLVRLVRLDGDSIVRLIESSSDFLARS